MEEMRNFEAPVPYKAFETIQARNKWRETRYIAIILVLIILLVGTNAAWLWYESQFETVTTTTQEVVQENEGGYNSFIGGDLYGNAESEDNNHNYPNP